jgi:50S ribosome-binding GTPase
MTTPVPLDRRVRALLDAASRAYADEPTLHAIRRRLDEPLRVAIAGRVKAGKSTLLNALIGQRLAATAAQECTRLPTWFQDGPGYRLLVQPRSGPAVQLPFPRDGAVGSADLGAHPVDRVERLIVERPSPTLRLMTLIDTPGIGSVSTRPGSLTKAMLTPDNGRPGDADAVVYLMRHLHADDAHFLESFHGTEAARPEPINALAVLSRADEVGGCSETALEAAARVAARYEKDERLRALCQGVVPVAGLLAEGGATLCEEDYRTLRDLAANLEQTQALTLSADRFARSGTTADVSPERRHQLLRRLGLFGVRRGIQLISTGAVTSSAQLARAFIDDSGIGALRELLAIQFAQRAHLLKAKSALAALEHVFRSRPDGRSTHFLREIEQLRSSAHEFAELSLCNALRSGTSGLGDRDMTAAERLLGAAGNDIANRLSLSSSSDARAQQQAATGALAYWRRRADDPLSNRNATRSAQTLTRTCEGILSVLKEADQR